MQETEKGVLDALAKIAPGQKFIVWSQIAADLESIQAALEAENVLEEKNVFDGVLSVFSHMATEIGQYREVIVRRLQDAAGAGDVSTLLNMVNLAAIRIKTVFRQIANNGSIADVFSIGDIRSAIRHVQVPQVEVVDARTIEWGSRAYVGLFQELRALLAVGRNSYASRPLLAASIGRHYGYLIERLDSLLAGIDKRKEDFETMVAIVSFADELSVAVSYERRFPWFSNDALTHQPDYRPLHDAVSFVTDSIFKIIGWNADLQIYFNFEDHDPVVKKFYPLDDPRGTIASYAGRIRAGPPAVISPRMQEILWHYRLRELTTDFNIHWSTRELEPMQNWFILLDPLMAKEHRARRDLPPGSYIQTFSRLQKFHKAINDISNETVHPRIILAHLWGVAARHSWYVQHLNKLWSDARTGRLPPGHLIRKDKELGDTFKEPALGLLMQHLFINEAYLLRAVATLTRDAFRRGLIDAQEVDRFWGKSDLGNSITAVLKAMKTDKNTVIVTGESVRNELRLIAGRLDLMRKAYIVKLAGSESKYPYSIMSLTRHFKDSSDGMMRLYALLHYGNIDEGQFQDMFFTESVSLRVLMVRRGQFMWSDADHMPLPDHMDDHRFIRGAINRIEGQTRTITPVVAGLSPRWRWPFDLLEGLRPGWGQQVIALRIAPYTEEFIRHTTVFFGKKRDRAVEDFVAGHQRVYAPNPGWQEPSKAQVSQLYVLAERFDKAYNRVLHSPGRNILSNVTDGLAKLMGSIDGRNWPQAAVWPAAGVLFLAGLIALAVELLVKLIIIPFSGLGKHIAASIAAGRVHADHNRAVYRAAGQGFYAMAGRPKKGPEFLLNNLHKLKSIPYGPVKTLGPKLDALMGGFQPADSEKRSRLRKRMRREPEHILALIHWARIVKGISIQDLAVTMGLDSKMLGKMIAGPRTVKQLISIARGLNVNPRIFLMNGIDFGDIRFAIGAFGRHWDIVINGGSDEEAVVGMGRRLLSRGLRFFNLPAGLGGPGETVRVVYRLREPFRRQMRQVAIDVDFYSVEGPARAPLASRSLLVHKNGKVEIIPYEIERATNYSGPSRWFRGLTDTIPSPLFVRLRRDKHDGHLRVTVGNIRISVPESLGSPGEQVKVVFRKRSPRGRSLDYLFYPRTAEYTEPPHLVQPIIPTGRGRVKTLPLRMGRDYEHQARALLMETGIDYEEHRASFAGRKISPAKARSNVKALVELGRTVTVRTIRSYKARRVYETSTMPGLVELLRAPAITLKDSGVKGVAPEDVKMVEAGLRVLGLHLARHTGKFFTYGNLSRGASRMIGGSVPVKVALGVLSRHGFQFRYRNGTTQGTGITVLDHPLNFRLMAQRMLTALAVGGIVWMGFSAGSTHDMILASTTPLLMVAAFTGPSASNLHHSLRAGQFFHPIKDFGPDLEPKMRKFKEPSVRTLERFRRRLARRDRKIIGLIHWVRIAKSHITVKDLLAKAKLSVSGHSLLLRGKAGHMNTQDAVAVARVLDVDPRVFLMRPRKDDIRFNYAFGIYWDIALNGGAVETADLTRRNKANERHAQSRNVYFAGLPLSVGGYPGKVRLVYRLLTPVTQETQKIDIDVFFYHLDMDISTDKPLASRHLTVSKNGDALLHPFEVLRNLSQMNGLTQWIRGLTDKVPAAQVAFLRRTTTHGLGLGIAGLNIHIPESLGEKGERVRLEFERPHPKSRDLVMKVYPFHSASTEPPHLVQLIRIADGQGTPVRSLRGRDRAHQERALIQEVGRNKAAVLAKGISFRRAREHARKMYNNRRSPITLKDLSLDLPPDMESLSGDIEYLGLYLARSWRMGTSYTYEQILATGLFGRIKGTDQLRTAVGFLSRNGFLFRYSRRRITVLDYPLNAYRMALTVHWPQP